MYNDPLLLQNWNHKLLIQGYDFTYWLIKVFLDQAGLSKVAEISHFLVQPKRKSFVLIITFLGGWTDQNFRPKQWFN